MAWARTHSVGDDVVYQKKRWWIPKFFRSWAFFPFARVKDTLYQVDWEINNHVDELLTLLGRRMVIQEQVEAELRDVKKQPLDDYGYGRPFPISSSELGKLKRGSVSKPPDDWKGVLAPHIKHKFKVDGIKSGGQKASAGHPNHVSNSGTPHAGRTVYTPEDLADKAVRFGSQYDADSFVGFKEPEKKKSSNASSEDKKQRRRQLVEQNPKEDFESAGEYDKRINRMLNEEFNNGGSS